MSATGNSYEEDDDYIKIAETENSDFMEFPKEEDGTLLLSTIQTQFPGAIGIKYKGSSGAWRAIKEVDNVLAAPKGGWGDNVYILTVAETKKRKLESADEETEGKHSRTAANPVLKDMAVIGVPFECTSQELREYFEKNYGELVFCEVKFHRDTGKSRGFGFIRFKDEATANEALKGEHYLMGRKFEVRLKKEKPMKLFVGRLPKETTKEGLEKHFSKFGELTDTYIPTPFRNFAFLTFASTEDGRACLQESHIFEGVRLNVTERNQDKNEQQRGGDRRGFGGDRSSGGGSFGGGYNPKYSGQQNMPQQNIPQQNMLQQNMQQLQQQNMFPQPAKNDMATDLKSMLFQFLTSKN